MTPMISSAIISALFTNLESACSVVGDSANRACNDAEHCESRSSGLVCGKNTLDGIPFAAGSNLKRKLLIEKICSVETSQFLKLV